MSFEQFFADNFATPLGQYYTPVNTVVYGIIFALAVFGVYKVLRKLDISIDKKFVIGIVPYIVLGSVLRVLRDAGTLNYPIFASPIIYMLMFGIAFLGLIIAVGVERIYKKKDHWFSSYHRLWSLIGILLVIIAFAMLIPIGYTNYYGSGLMLGLTAIWAVVLYILYEAREKLGHKYKFLGVFTKENCIILGAHLFDASTTFVALQYFPYYEQHVVSNFVIAYLGPAGQFALKLVVVTTVLWALDKYIQGNPHNIYDKDNVFMRNFLKIAIFILGFAPGFRNFLRVGFGV